ncbi:hypothetical protein PPYR_02898 [Photinus pyralis]|uniref:Major facilitator superfamily (MFS) profile domain-containing protein n=1 Tax=Photinus pyralis TaxID=7054 RepID=A0A1Y1LMZ7_PHOPY|nr:hypothetical protein PPYR_02898 [Photinus pyralis]
MLGKRIIPNVSEGNALVQICSVLIVSIGGFSIGAHFAWPSPSTPQLIQNTSYIGQVTIEEASYFSVISGVSTIASSFLVANAMKHVGRKRIIWSMTIPQLLSWILIAQAKSIAPIYIARALSGIGEAIGFCTITVYIGEITTPELRGKWGSMFSCATLLGNLCITVANDYIGIATAAYIFLFAPLLQLVLVALLPDSPYFLLEKGRYDDAKAALRQLRWKTDVDDEFLALRKDVERQISESGSFMDLLKIVTNRRALWVITYWAAHLPAIQRVFRVRHLRAVHLPVSRS